MNQDVYVATMDMLAMVAGASVLSLLAGWWLGGKYATQPEEWEEIELADVALEPIEDGVWYDPAGHFVFSAPYLMRQWPGDDVRKMLEHVTSLAVAKQWSLIVKQGGEL